MGGTAEVAGTFSRLPAAAGGGRSDRLARLDPVGTGVAGDDPSTGPAGSATTYGDGDPMTVDAGRASVPPARTVQSWARWAAYGAAWSAVPSGLWRLGLALGVPVGFSGEMQHTLQGDIPNGATVYMIGLSVVAECLALLSLGLVRTWGEVVPAWVPILGGRRIPPLAAIIPATAGAVALTLCFAIIPLLTGAFADSRNNPDSPDGVALLIMDLCYAPLAVWGPLLAIATYGYYRRTPRGDRVTR